MEDTSQLPETDANDVDDGIGGQSTRSSDWDDTGADDEKRDSEIENREDNQSIASENEGERRYREIESKCSKVIALISISTGRSS